MWSSSLFMINFSASLFLSTGRCFLLRDYLQPSPLCIICGNLYPASLCSKCKTKPHMEHIPHHAITVCLLPKNKKEANRCFWIWICRAIQTSPLLHSLLLLLPSWWSGNYFWCPWVRLRWSYFCFDCFGQNLQPACPLTFARSLLVIRPILVSAFILS